MRQDWQPTGQAVGWVQRFIDALKKKGTPEQRAACARACYLALGGGLPASWRAENAADLAEKRASVTEEARQAIAKLKGVEGDAVPDLETVTRRNRYADWEQELVHRAAETRRSADEARRRQPKKPGPRNDRERVLIRRLADAYRVHLGQEPGFTQRKDAPTPFMRLCDAVEELLEHIGQNITFSPQLRRWAVVELRAANIVTKSGKTKQN